jgi:hypothetical protein
MEARDVLLSWVSMVIWRADRSEQPWENFDAAGAIPCAPAERRRHATGAAAGVCQRSREPLLAHTGKQTMTGDAARQHPCTSFI